VEIGKKKPANSEKKGTILAAKQQPFKGKDIFAPEVDSAHHVEKLVERQEGHIRFYKVRL
jgi:hypothetical protein